LKKFKRATKLVISLKKLPYKERLLQLNLHTLKYRRLRGEMIEAIEKVQKSYKISDITQKVTIQRTFITIKFTYFEIQTIRGLRGEMIEVYKIIHMYDRSVALELPRNVPSNKYNK